VPEEIIYACTRVVVMPPTHETVDARKHFVYQEGQAVFKFAVKGMADVSAEMIEKH